MYVYTVHIQRKSSSDENIFNLIDTSIHIQYIDTQFVKADGYDGAEVENFPTKNATFKYKIPVQFRI